MKKQDKALESTKIKSKSSNGITLIALVISIIVMLILAGVSLNATIGENGIVTRAQEANLAQALATYKEELEVNKTGIRIEKIDNAQDFKDLGIYVVGEEVKKYIPSLEDNYVGRIAIFNSELVYTSENITENEKKVTDNLGILIMQTDDYNYMIELNYLAMAVAVHSEDSVKIGTALGTAGNTYETIAGINYGLGWYKISTTDELKSLGLTNTELTYMTHGPYIVKYNTAAVQSIKGKLMYAGTTNEIWKYTFNYFGEEGGITVSGLLSGVTADSLKTEEKFGDFAPSHKLASSGATQDVIDNYYKDPYIYDTDGGLILGETTNILSMPVDQTKPINSKFSICITIKCDMYDCWSIQGQYTDQKYGGNVFAISPLLNYYVIRTSIYNGILRVHTFTDITNEKTVDERTCDGFVSFDVSKYNNKYLNIQVTSEVNGKTKVYLNGSLAKEFNSGHYDNLKYDYCTIGDLRPGRGFKFLGNIYNFALYGDILTEEQVAQNWNYIKNELKINEAGDKVN